MDKNKILAKFNIDINDYNNKLEKILENKLYSYDVKNLLLSMLYKIENAYKDYQNVKIGVPSKKDYIENILEIIKEKALKIFIVKAGTEDAKSLEENNVLYKVDKINGEIVCFQNEVVLLKALFTLDASNNEFKSLYSYLEEPLNTVLNIGKIDSKVEVIRDFNGWSWDIVLREIESIEYNFIYQNLILQNSKSQMCNEIIKCAIKQYISDKNNTNFRKKLEKIYKEKEDRLKLFENKKEFLNKITEEKKEYTRQIEKIDKILNDSQLLKEEYYSRNAKLQNKEKIFSVSYLVGILNDERENLLEQINECNRLILPKEFIEQKERIEREVEFVDSIFNETLEEDIIQVCRKFLEKAKEKIDKINEENKEELINWIYKIRYYRYIPVNCDGYIRDIRDLEEDFEKIIKQIIRKAQNLKIWDVFTEDFNLCYKVIKEIFNSKIINLEGININFRYENKVLFVEYYDDTVIENTMKMEVENVRIKKKVKLFI